MSTYLTEKNLGEYLNAIFETEFINNMQIGKYRVDWYSPKLSIGVEFDGYRHYNDSMTQYRDKLKDSFLQSLDITVMRIPYFIQLSKETINSLLLFKGSFNREWQQKYPHGFIDPKALKPADFNEIGVRRFLRDLDKIQLTVRDEIINSLIDRAQEVKLKISDAEKLNTVIPLSVTQEFIQNIDFSNREELLYNLQMNLLI